MAGTKTRFNDPIERTIAEALEASGIEFKPNPENHLDFELPRHELFSNSVVPVYIECKQFHSDRIAEQCSRADNVIVIQGAEAAKLFASLLRVYGDR